jgi:hypothetical protein
LGNAVQKDARAQRCPSQIDDRLADTGQTRQQNKQQLVVDPFGSLSRLQTGYNGAGESLISPIVKSLWNH